MRCFLWSESINFLLDIMLPKIHGLDVLKELKKNKRTGKIPVVLLTNLGQEEVIKEGFRLGAEAYLIKAAYTPNQVVQEIKNLRITTSHHCEIL